MYRPLLAALFVAFCTGSLATVAQAQPTTSNIPALMGPPPAAATISQMPSPNADLAMWSGDAGRAAHQPLAHRRGVPHLDAIHRLARNIIRRSSSLALHLTRNAMRFIGTPYVFGGTSPGGFDCSGYVQHVFAMLGVPLPRTADAQYYAGHPTRGGMAAGDLVFFQTYESGPSHVGIYLGHGRFIHSSSSRGVMISSISERYWSARYLGAKRVARVLTRIPLRVAAR